MKPQLDYVYHHPELIDREESSSLWKQLKDFAALGFNKALNNFINQEKESIKRFKNMENVESEEYLTFLANFLKQLDAARSSIDTLPIREEHAVHQSIARKGVNPNYLPLPSFEANTLLSNNIALRLNAFEGKIQKLHEHQEKLRDARLSEERLAQVEKERLAQVEKERLAQVEKERLAQVEKERLAQVEKERLAQVEKERLAQVEKERLAQVEKERLAQVEKERLAQVEKERLAQVEKERLAQVEKERLAQVEKERLAQVEKERLAQVEKERLAQVEKERLAQVEKERLAQVEKERLAQVEKERLAQVEKERLAQVEKERLAQVEKERLAQVEKERLAQVEKERLAQVEKERLAQVEKERLAQEKYANTIARHKLSFDTYLAELKLKTDELISKGNPKSPIYNSNYQEVAQKADALYTQLETAGKVFFNPANQPTSETFLTFINSCADAMKNARGSFENQRSLWGKIPTIFKAIIGLILSIPVGLPSLVLGYGAAYKDTFFCTPPTDSIKKLNAFYSKVTILTDDIEKESPSLGGAS